jgi:ubiquinone/menaquinone biosynthesis C-methylase UbiE
VTGPLDQSPRGTELLDDLTANPTDIELSLENIARSNFWFGGQAAVRFGVRQVLRGRRLDALAVLDVGAGFGDVAADLVRVGRRDGIRVRPIGVERHPVASRVAARRGLPMILADGMALPLPDRSMDLVVISQVAHHLTDRQIAALAAEATRVARLGVVLADLKRSELAVLLFRVASRALRFDRATRRDGVTSVRRGFRRVQLETILRQAGRNVAVVERPFARLVATWRTD